MTAYNVKFIALTDMVGYVAVDADTPQAAVTAARKVLPTISVDWEFVDSRDAISERAVEVWDSNMEDVVFEVDDSADDPEWPAEDWRQDVANRDTRLGYSDWVAHNRESADSEARDGMGNRLDGGGELDSAES